MFIYVGNSKGGTGNSTVSALVVEHFLARGEKPVLVDGGGCPHDVHRVYKDAAKCLVRDEADSWTKELDGNAPVILNSGSGAAARLERDAMILKELGGGAVMLWTMEQYADSVVMLDKFLGMGANPKTCLVKNGFWGEEDDFEALAKSRFASAPSVYLPKMPGPMTAMFFNESVPFGKMHEKMSAGGRLFAESWLKKAVALIGEALRIAGKVAPVGA